MPYPENQEEGFECQSELLLKDNDEEGFEIPMNPTPRFILPKQAK